ncbi:hypothetical protein AB0L70_31815 [Kribbella sp. NPDC051952]|uniref:hypothetical protein n=1 Tax=Kribbella sp. NPDC051952 TaxID=3154851 RepID=UPI00342CA52B
MPEQPPRETPPERPEDLRNILRAGLSGVAGPEGAVVRHQGDPDRPPAAPRESAGRYVETVLAMDDEQLQAATPELHGATAEGRRHELIMSHPGGLNAFSDVLAQQQRQQAATSAEAPATADRRVSDSERQVTGSRVNNGPDKPGIKR